MIRRGKRSVHGDLETHLNVRLRAPYSDSRTRCGSTCYTMWYEKPPPSYNRGNRMANQTGRENLTKCSHRSRLYQIDHNRINRYNCRNHCGRTVQVA